MADLFKDPPMAAFKRQRNLKDMVVRGRLYNPLPNSGFKTCSDARCLLCKHSTNTDSFKSPISGRTYKIFGKASCRTDSFIYLISCKVCLRWLTVCYRHSTFSATKYQIFGPMALAAPYFLTYYLNTVLVR